MARETWAAWVPASTTPRTARPLALDRYLWQTVPVHVEVVTTAVGGVTVTLPAAFQAVISSIANYRVRMTPQGFNPAMGQPHISDKTTAGFKLQTSGDVDGAEVLVEVLWMP